jgi:release factor glutamine methyltransferase
LLSDTVLWSELLAEATERLSAISESPEIDARRIVESAAGFETADFAAGLADAVTNRGMSSFDAMLARRLLGEPLQYVVGSWSFRYLDLFLDNRVLIPRPETEVVAGLALDEIDFHDAQQVADLGTGSGAIALSLATEREVAVWATDVSAEALVVARANLAAIGQAATRVRMVQGVWFEALPASLEGRLDVIVSNPPYVATTEKLPPVVADWEPGRALFAGLDGTDDLTHLISEAETWLSPKGSLVLEMAPQQTERLAELALVSGFAEAAIHEDLSGRPRALVARR